MSKEAGDIKDRAFVLAELFILGALILNGAGKTAPQKKAGTFKASQGCCMKVLRSAKKMYMPAAVYAMPKEEGHENALQSAALLWLPLAKYSRLISQDEVKEGRAGIGQRDVTYEKTEEKPAPYEGEEAEEPPKNEEPLQKEEAPQRASCLFPDREALLQQMRDFDYLIGNYYTVDSSTAIGPEQLDADDLLLRDMRIDTDSEGPKVLIFHTHSQEAFADSAEGDPSTSVVGVGQYLCDLLNEAGIKTLHDCGVYDIIDGKLDRSSAYEQAEFFIRPILDENPSIEVVIDLHRDGVPDWMRLVTETDGKPTAKVMYFNGLSRLKESGDIDYLYNPYIQDNLAFSLQMKLISDKLYPDFARRIYLSAYRYNLHLRPKSLLIEAGAQTNTVSEMKNAMEALAVVLKTVLTEKIIS